MLIAGFGGTYADANIFPVNMPEDDWTLQRPAAARRVPFAGGAYDFSGTMQDALAAYIVRKKFVLVSNYGHLEGDVSSLRKSLFGLGESKLWLDVRDGTHRWAWAKCTKFSLIEKVENQESAEINIEFYLRQGLWYGETLRQDGWVLSGGHWDIVNAGNIATPVKVSITAKTTPITYAYVGKHEGGTTIVRFEYRGSIAADKALVVDPAIYSAKNDGVGCYNDMTFLHADERGRWLTIDPGTTRIDFGGTGGSGASTISFEWYDAWV